MSVVNELFNTIQEHYTEFEANHLEFVEKGNKAAAGRARKHIGEIKKLVTGYRKESVSSCKMEFVFNSLQILTFLGVGYLVYISR